MSNAFQIFFMCFLEFLCIPQCFVLHRIVVAQIFVELINVTFLQSGSFNFLYVFPGISSMLLDFHMKLDFCQTLTTRKICFVPSSHHLINSSSGLLFPWPNFCPFVAGCLDGLYRQNRQDFS